MGTSTSRRPKLQRKPARRRRGQAAATREPTGARGRRSPGGPARYVRQLLELHPEFQEHEVELTGSVEEFLASPYSRSCRDACQRANALSELLFGRAPAGRRPRNRS